MDFIKKNKIAVGVATVFLLIFAYYIFFSGSGTPSTDTSLVSSVSESPADALVGGQILTVLSQLKSMQMDTTFFTKPNFVNLIDYSVELAPQPVGRTNPFSPLGRSGEATTTLNLKK